MNKKATQTTSLTEKEQDDQKTNFGLLLAVKSLIIKLIILGIVIGGAYYLYQNPSLWKKYLPETKEDTSQNEAMIIQINQLQNQVAALQSQILNLPAPDLSSFEEKVASLEKQNLNVIDSKADASIVLGMLTRVDKLENRLDKLAKISDDGALILSAAMLVKQAAEEGGSFVYEAEVLNQLAPSATAIQKDISVILEFARNGIASKQELARQFKNIYASVQPTEDESDKTWKERLNNKLNEYIKISKKGEHQEEVVSQNQLDEIMLLVADKNIKKAVKLIESSDNDDIKQNRQIQSWLVDAQNMISFNQAIRNIAAYCLAEMKVNNLKNKD